MLHESGALLEAIDAYKSLISDLEGRSSGRTRAFPVR